MKRIVLFAACALLAGSGAANAQFIGEREDTAVTVSSLLSSCTDEYTLQASTGQLLFLDIDHVFFGGFQDFCLEIVSPTGVIEKAADSGFFFDLDPALGFFIPTTGTRRVRVSLNDGSCGDGTYTDCVSSAGEPSAFYHLNVSLRNRAPESTVPLAVNTSRNLLGNLQ